MKDDNAASQVHPKFQQPKLIIVTRADISSGYQVVQSTHSIADFAHEFPERFKLWKSESNSIIVLSVATEEKLLRLFSKLANKGADIVKFHEPDIENEVTSLCVYGTPEIRKKLSYLSLCLGDRT